MNTLECLVELKSEVEMSRRSIEVEREMAMADRNKSRRAMKLHSVKYRESKVAVLEKAINIIRDGNEIAGAERFCPRCEERLASEGVCEVCDSEQAEETPCHRSAKES